MISSEPSSPSTHSDATGEETKSGVDGAESGGYRTLDADEVLRAMVERKCRRQNLGPTGSSSLTSTSTGGSGRRPFDFRVGNNYKAADGGPAAGVGADPNVDTDALDSERPVSNGSNRSGSRDGDCDGKNEGGENGAMIQALSQDVEMMLCNKRQASLRGAEERMKRLEAERDSRTKANSGNSRTVGARDGDAAEGKAADRGDGNGDGKGAKPSADQMADDFMARLRRRATELQRQRTDLLK